MDIGIGVIGYGYLEPNLVRGLRGLDARTTRRRMIASPHREPLADVSVEPRFDDPGDERALVPAAFDRPSIGTVIHHPIPIDLRRANASLALGRGSFPHAERAAAAFVEVAVAASPR